MYYKTDAGDVGREEPQTNPKVAGYKRSYQDPKDNKKSQP